MNVQQEFWKWFLQHEAELYNFEADQERLFDELATELQKVNPDLTFEFGPKETKREFIVSAGGIKDAFSAVVGLVAASPGFVRWRVTAFRPRRNVPGIVEFRGKRVHPEAVQFSLLDNGQRAGIYLFIPGFREDDADLKQIGYQLLDDTLGEYDVESKLGLIKMLSPQAPTIGERHPLTDLPTRFDELVLRLEGRSEKPS